MVGWGNALNNGLNKQMRGLYDKFAKKMYKWMIVLNEIIVITRITRLIKVSERGLNFSQICQKRWTQQ